MNVLVPITMFGWIPVVLALFALLPARRAVLVGFFVAWCFLPMAGFKFPGIPDYTKVTATTVGVLLGIFIFDSGRVLKFRPRVWDVFILAWCGVPLLSSISAGWGVYEGLSLSLNRSIIWLVCYFVGRLYFSDLHGLRELAVGFFIAGLAYVPLCLIEIRLSPQLHTWVYGYHQHVFLMTVRGGGWRPTVFMQHGLAVGTFMCTAALIGFWLWRCKVLRTVLGVPVWIPSLVLAGTAVLCKSTGATLLAMGGAALLVFMKWTRWWMPMAALIAVPGVYILLRTIGGWQGQELLELARMISPDRAQSLEFRLMSETRLWQIIQSDLLLGLSRFNLADRLPDGELGVTPDGMWLIALACNGVVGLVAFVGMLATPLVLFVRRYRVVLWSHPAAAPAAVLAVCFGLYAVDFLFNAMENPVLIMIGGGLVGLLAPAVVDPARISAAAPSGGAAGPAWFAAPGRPTAGGSRAGA